MEQIIWHEEYNSRILKNDIALLKLKTPIELNLFDYKVKLPIENAYFSTGTQATLVGWGRIGTALPISTVLQRADLQIFNRYDCSQLHGDDEILYNNICAGVTGGGQGQCNGENLELLI